MLRAGRGPYRQKYSADSLIKAEEAVRCGMAIKRAVREYGVPRATLQDRVHNRIKSGTQRSGPDPVLTKAEEQRLVEYIKACSKVGYPLDKKDVKDTVKRIIDDDGRINKFIDNRPGKMLYIDNF